jgi:hypothetical protein
MSWDSGSGGGVQSVGGYTIFRNQNGGGANPIADIIGAGGFYEDFGSNNGTGPVNYANDFVDTGQTLNYYAATVANDPNGNPYYSSGFGYDFIGDSNGEAFSITHTFNSSTGNVKIRNGTGSIISGGSFTEYLDTLASGSQTLTPTGYGYTGDGSTYYYRVYAYNGTIGIYAASFAEFSIQSVNDGQPYYNSMSYFAAAGATSYKILRGTDGETYGESFITTNITFNDLATISWGSNVTITPNGILPPSVIFETNATGNGDKPNLILKGLNDYNRIDFMSADGSINSSIESENGKLKLSGITLNLSMLPTSSSGLSAGEIWVDSGTLKRV